MKIQCPECDFIGNLDDFEAEEIAIEPPAVWNCICPECGVTFDSDDDSDDDYDND